MVKNKIVFSFMANIINAMMKAELVDIRDVQIR